MGLPGWISCSLNDLGSWLKGKYTSYWRKSPVNLQTPLTSGAIYISFSIDITSGKCKTRGWYCIGLPEKLYFQECYDPLSLKREKK